MAREKIFKFQNLKILRYSDYKELANIRTAASVSFNLNPELAEQMTGPSLFPIETEVSTVGTEASINIGEYSREVMSVLMGADSTVQEATSGHLATPTNVKGTGLFLASGGGIISATLDSDTSKIRSGLYRVSIPDGSANNIEVHALSSPELAASEYEDFSKSLVKKLEMADGKALETGIGVTLTCAGTVALDNISSDDAFIFRVYSPSVEAFESKIGQTGLQIPKVKIITTSRRLSDGRWFEVLWHNCIFPGLNFNFADEFSANEVTGKIIFDETTGRLGEAYFRRKVN